MNSINQLPNPETTFHVIGEFVRFAETIEPVEQRISVRQQIHQPIRVDALNSSFCDLGESFDVLSRDVSVAGVGFFSVHPVRARYLRLQFTECEQASVIVEVVHQNQRGPFWIIGCKFLVDWESADWGEFVSDGDA